MAKEIKVAPVFRGSKVSVVMKGKLPATPLETIDRYLKELKENQLRWAQDYPISKRIELLEETLRNIEKYKDEWAKGDLIARHDPKGNGSETETLIFGPGPGGLATRVFIEILRKIEKDGPNKPFAKARQDGDR